MFPSLRRRSKSAPAGAPRGGDPAGRVPRSVPRLEPSPVIQVGGRLVRARERRVGDTERCKKESGIAEYEAVISAFAVRAEQGKRAINPRELEAALRPQVAKVAAMQQLLLLAAFVPADNKGPLTRAWLQELTEREYRLLEWEEMRQNPGSLTPIFAIQEAIAQAFGIDDKPRLRRVIESCLDGTAMMRFFGGPSEERS